MATERRMPGVLRNDGPVAPLVPLADQPAGVPWPTDDWPRSGTRADVAVERLLDEVFRGGVYGKTYAVVVIQGGCLLTERYANEIEHWDRPNERGRL